MIPWVRAHGEQDDPTPVLLLELASRLNGYKAENKRNIRDLVNAFRMLCWLFAVEIVLLAIAAATR